MSAPAPDSTRWFKSSHSAGVQDCLEVAVAPGTVFVRDSKRKTGPILELAPTGFAKLVAFVAQSGS
ncbi:DUF397 domain-containing protein [Streptomyces sp. NPDC047014]|uniref:DUF397 domain-containing protein n=1 Tax=Streptomyces sp. NPDC047014 TaxID=3155736 RepID=UPI0033D98AC7